MGYWWPTKKNKYGAVRSGGFGSKLERAVYNRLLLYKQANVISNIQQQVTVDLSCGIRWKVDFSFFDEIEKCTVWAEAKGVETERYRLCLKLWQGGHGPGRLEIWKGHYSDPRVVKVITPLKSSHP